MSKLLKAAYNLKKYLNSNKKYLVISLTKSVLDLHRKQQTLLREIKNSVIRYSVLWRRLNYLLIC